MSLPFKKINPTPKTIFSVQGDSGGLATLPTDLTINSTTVSPTYWYQGKDASTSSWTTSHGSGGTLTGAGSGGTADLDSPTPHADDRAVADGGTRSWEGSSINTLDDDDFVIEAVLKFSTATVGGHYAATQTSGNEGFHFYRKGSTDQLEFEFTGASGTSTVTSASLTNGAWYHVVIFVDRSGSAQFYINGATSGSAGLATGAGTMTDVTGLFLMDRSGSTQEPDGAIAHFALWKQSAWLDTHLQASVALERYARVAGVWSTQATIQSNSRSTAGYLDRVSPQDSSVRKAFYMGAGWHRWVRRPDTADTIKSGYLSEEARTNLVTNNTTLSSLNNISGCALAQTDAVEAPDGSTAWDLRSSGGDVGHYCGHSQVASTHAGKVFVKAGVKTWCAVQALGGNYFFVNLSTGAIGAIYGSISPVVEDWGNGWYSIGYSGQASVEYVFVYACASDDDLTYDSADDSGDAALYVARHQLESVSAGDVCSSQIDTSGSTATRTLDDLEYNTTVDLSKGTLACDILVPKGIDAANERLIWITDDTSNNRISAMVDATEESLRSIMLDGGATQANVTSYTELTDGYWHEARSTWAENAFHVYVNGNEEGTADSSCTVPSGLDKIHIGNEQGGASPSNGVVINPRLYKKPTLKNVSIDLSGIADLPRALYINKQSVDPTYWYEARNASLTDWSGTGEGGTLTAAGSGGSVGNTVPTSGGTDKSVDCEETRRWDGSTTVNIGTDDVVVEFVAQFPTGSYTFVAGTRSTTNGLYCRRYTTNDVWQIGILGSGGASINSGAGMVEGDWYHVMAFIDQSGSGRMYINGVETGGNVNMSTYNCSDDAPLTIGAIPGGSGGANHNSGIAHFAMWKSSGWLDTHLQPNVAASRYAILGLE